MLIDEILRYNFIEEEASNIIIIYSLWRFVVSQARQWMQSRVSPGPYILENAHFESKREN